MHAYYIDACDPALWNPSRLDGGGWGFWGDKQPDVEEISPREPTTLVKPRRKDVRWTAAPDDVAAREMDYPHRDWPAGQAYSNTCRMNELGARHWDPQCLAMMVVLVGENRRKEPHHRPHQQPRGCQGR